VKPSWVTIWRFVTLAEALLAKGKLEAGGIPSILSNEHMANMGYTYAVGGVALQVAPEYADEALALLQEPIPAAIKIHSSSPSYMQPRCPECSSLNVTDEGPVESISAGTWLTPGFTIRDAATGWRCSSCGHRWQSQNASPDRADVSPEVSTRIYVATTNPGKLKDFAHAADMLGVQVVPFPSLSSAPEVLEDGITFEANAVKKGEAYSALLPNELVIADDSGLEVAALNGAPGVYSARFAQTDAQPSPSDSDNNYKLLYEMSLHPQADRSARFVCVIAAARDGKVLKTFRGEAAGEILPTPIGRKGFGYDPLFFVPLANKTFGEMTAEEKAEHSHRGQAFRAFLDWLKPEVARS
jgi:XTP/dITP diphosphohydrolase